MWLPMMVTYYHRLGVLKVGKIGSVRSHGDGHGVEFADTLWRVSDCLTEARLAAEQGQVQEARLWQARAQWWARTSGSPELLRLVGQYAASESQRTGSNMKLRKRTRNGQPIL
jgi:hypothetical protein